MKSKSTGDEGDKGKKGKSKKSHSSKKTDVSIVVDSPDPLDGKQQDDDKKKAKKKRDHKKKESGNDPHHKKDKDNKKKGRLRRIGKKDSVDESSQSSHANDKDNSQAHNRMKRSSSFDSHETKQPPKRSALAATCPPQNPNKNSSPDHKNTDQHQARQSSQELYTNGNASPNISGSTNPFSQDDLLGDSSSANRKSGLPDPNFCENLTNSINYQEPAPNPYQNNNNNLTNSIINNYEPTSYENLTNSMNYPQNSPQMHPQTNPNNYPMSNNYASPIYNYKQTQASPNNLSPKPADFMPTYNQNYGQNYNYPQMPVQQNQYQAHNNYGNSYPQNQYRLNQNLIQSSNYAPYPQQYRMPNQQMNQYPNYGNQQQSPMHQPPPQQPPMQCMAPPSPTGPGLDVGDSWEIDYSELEIEKEIARGSFGVVEKGTFRGTEVAVKTLIQQKLSPEQMVEFSAEINMLKKLHHPNVVLLIGVCTKPPHLALVTEFMTGSMWNLLHDRSVNLLFKTKIKLINDTAKGMNYLHLFKPAVLHRDLKSANLLVDQHFNVKIADFGLARMKAQMMTGNLGTCQYMAPEVISSENYTEKADIYSFAIVIWEVLTRKPPYEGMQPMQIAFGTVHKGLRPPIPNNQDPQLVGLMIQCWDTNPAQRPSFTEI
eukprot:CAMPEP_0174254562 /NCGR_PEP_ID=MMETSP0439-20130205/3882_1 /TAXON_ID=0 /ORGANISM="Stereomyxa ramosa, Strain Chinc5" /LENGTH=654 /DNA_ID=CAMNT_0015336225 /DNA_START=52 /DNA_END=2013 /DNA_ORIENTATION=+